MTVRGTVTNYWLQSDGLIVSPWAMNAGFASSLAGQADPFGGTRATRLTETVDGGATSHFLYQNQPASLYGKRVCASVYFLPGTRTCLNIAPNGGGNAVGFDGVALTSIGTNGTIAGQGVITGIEVVQGAPSWRRAWVIYTMALSAIELRYYASDVQSSANYQGNGSIATTLFGAQLEIVQPGQTTPSPYAPSGATAGVGRRETRQNLLPWSEDQSRWSTFFQSTALGGQTGPDGLANATLLTDTVSALGGHWVGNTLPIQPSKGSICTYCGFAKAGTVPRIQVLVNLFSTVDAGIFTLSGAGTAAINGTKAISATIRQSGLPGWYFWTLRYFHDSDQARVYLDNGTTSAFVGDGTHNALIAKLQLTQTNREPDYIKTTSAPANANGAPRLIVV